jgi:hypothetical protein
MTKTETIKFRCDSCPDSLPCFFNVKVEKGGKMEDKPILCPFGYSYPQWREIKK